MVVRDKRADAAEDALLAVLLDLDRYLFGVKRDVSTRAAQVATFGGGMRLLNGTVRVKTLALAVVWWAI